MNLKTIPHCGLEPTTVSQIKQVKEATNIVDIISERIELQRAGANLKANCPFHSEKSPSFFVNEQLQRYRCFGCGETGDVFNFLEKYEGMTFAESLKYLADRAGIELKEFTPSEQDERRDNILAILELSKSFFHYLLTEHKSGEQARQYFKDRGITNQSIKVFQLGFVPDGWDHLLKYLHKKKKYSLADIESAGMILKGKNGRYYDRFRGRVMYPLTNHRGQVVGFSGRVLEKDAKSAKYINTPETEVYHKSELLFGYSQLYQEIRKAEEVIVAEGEMDVISSTQAHVNNIVAIKGSALTEEQLKLLKRTVDKVLLSLDMDSAGIEATKRGIGLAQKYDLELRVIQIPGGKDPDELARENPKAWRDATKSSISVYEFFLLTALKKHDQNSPEGKRKIIDELAPIFGEISHLVEQDFYIKKLADALQVREAVVKADILKFKNKGKLETRKQKTEENKEKIKDKRQKLEEFLLFVLLRFPTEEIIAKAKKLLDIQLKTTGLKQIVKQLAVLPDEFDLSSFSANLAEDLQSLLSEIYLSEEYLNSLEDMKLEAEWQHSLNNLKQMVVSERIKEITEKLDKLDGKTNKTEVDEKLQAELLREIVLLKRA